MPTNLYGPGDNYDLQTSHVLPALIRKMHEAKERGDREVVVWGTGTPRREFLYSDDMADACLKLMNLSDDLFDAMLAQYQPPLINVGCGEDVTIRELAETVAKVIGFQGKLAFDTGKPDGTMRKMLDVARIGTLGWAPRFALGSGIARAYSDYLSRSDLHTAAGAPRRAPIV
jgi:GDP-L-fucose synthase